MGFNKPLTVKVKKVLHHVGDWVKVKKRSSRSSTYLMTEPQNWAGLFFVGTTVSDSPHCSPLGVSKISIIDLFRMVLHAAERVRAPRNPYGGAVSPGPVVEVGCYLRYS